jgi:hypothetical protein
MSELGEAVSSIGALPTASPLLSDFIDPQTNDFVSLFVSLDPIDLQVITALKLVRGTGPAIMEDGNNLNDIKKISKTVLNDIESEVKIALSRLIRNGDIQYSGIKDTIVEPGAQYVQWMVEWKNLRAIEKGPLRSAALTFRPGG